MKKYPIYKLTSIGIDEIISLKQTEDFLPERPEVKNKIRKLVFFLIREGVFRTIKKIKSKKDKTQLKKYHTTIIVKSGSHELFNYSCQSTTNIEQFVISNQFYIKPATEFQLQSKLIFNQFDGDFKSNETITLPVTETYEIKGHFVNGVFLYGLGDYSRVYIAPKIKRLNKIFCIDYNYKTSADYKQQFNYKYCGLVPQESYEVLQSTANPLALIATYHSDHTRIANEIFNVNPNTLIFIEKPPCVTLEDINILHNLYNKGAKIEIGFNRRYIPINCWIKERCFDEQKVINISVKEILINENHWYFWKNQGTRITGNLIHWIDLSVFWINGVPIEINLLSSSSEDETVAVSILFSDGSLVNITVSDKGDSLRGVQELIEVRTMEETFVINDYCSFKYIQANGKKRVKKFILRKKGHDLMYKKLLKTYQEKETSKYTKEDLIKTSLTTYYISQMFEQKIKNLNIEEKIHNYNELV